jgi:hypothetical protein
MSIDGTAASRTFKLLDPIEHFIFQSKLWKFLTVVAVLSMVRSGIWFIPNIGAQVLMSQDPFINPFNDPALYLMWNWLGTFVAWLIGATSLRGFFLLHLTFSLLFSAGFATLCVTRLQARDARIAIVLFSLLPASFTSYLWVSYDSLTLLLMVCALATSRFLVLALAVGVLLGMQHFEQAFVATCAIAAAALLRGQREREYSTLWAFTLLAGVVLGRAALNGIYAYHGVHLVSGRVSWLDANLKVVLWQFFYHSQPILWSTLGLGWVLAIKAYDDGKSALSYMLPLLGIMMMMPLIGDQTRVFALSSFLLLSVYWLLNPKFLSGFSGRVVAALFAVGNLMPVSWVWGGVARWSAFPFDVAFVLHHFTTVFNVPADLGSWPFSF